VNLTQGHPLELLIENGLQWKRIGVQQLSHGPVATHQVHQEALHQRWRYSSACQKLHHIKQVARVLPVERGDQFAGIHLIHCEHLCFDIPELVRHGFAYRHRYREHYAAAEHRRDFHLDADTTRRYQQPLASTGLSRRSR